VTMQETAFFARITAAVTHEFMNVLSTIKETSGLMADLLSLSEGASFPHHEKFSRSLGVIREQVRRGMAIGGVLNAFAHSADEPEAVIEINELLGQLSILVQRFARLKRIELTVIPLEAPLKIRTDPFWLQWVLVTCLEYCLDHTASGGKVTLQAHRRMKGVALQCLMGRDAQSANKMNGALPEWEGIREVLNQMNAQLISIHGPGQQGLELILSSKSREP
jgi:C4-dicarboxylate-specific signal transduction histidine kinase